MTDTNQAVLAEINVQDIMKGRRFSKLSADEQKAVQDANHARALVDARFELMNPTGHDKRVAHEARNLLKLSI